MGPRFKLVRIYGTDLNLEFPVGHPAMNRDSLSDIKQFINREIRPRIERIRSVREERGRLFYLSAIGSTIFVVASLAVAGINLRVETFSAVEFGVATGVVVAYGVALHGLFHLLFVNGARREWVDEIAAPVVDRLHPGVDHRPDDAMDRNEFTESAIPQFPVDQFESRDLFEATIDEGSLRFSEVVASRRVRRPGGPFWRRETCFFLRGLLFSARMKRRFRGTTVIIPAIPDSQLDALPRIEVPHQKPDPLVRPAEGLPHIHWQPEYHGEPMGEVSVPDPEFRHLFDVHTTDISEARGLLRPPLVEKLKATWSVLHSDVHRTPATRATGQGHFMVVLQAGRLHLVRPMPRSLDEIRGFPPREQTELLVQFARDVRMSIELVEAVGRGE